MVMFYPQECKAASGVHQLHRLSLGVADPQDCWMCRLCIVVVTGCQITACGSKIYSMGHYDASCA
jgi:hypothetical protein